MRPLVTERTDYGPSLTYWRRERGQVGTESVAVKRVRAESFVPSDGFRAHFDIACIEIYQRININYFYGYL